MVRTTSERDASSTPSSGGFKQKGSCFRGPSRVRERSGRNWRTMKTKDVDMTPKASVVAEKVEQRNLL